MSTEHKITDEDALVMLLANVVVVLHRPQDSVNVGSVIRAMKNMGMSDLRLVQPEPLERSTILRVAHGGEDLLDQMRSYAGLDEAIADTHYVVGTAALTHKARPQTTAIRETSVAWAARLRQGKLAFLFGQEDNGLNHDALDRCHLLVTLPTNPTYPALNLAQSVLLLLYEVRMAVMAGVPFAASPTPVATQAELERIFQISATLLGSIGFFKGNQTAVMRKLRQIVYKAALSPEEAALVTAILRRVERGT
ncbi:MAG: TrmJ/YjtD family RNA methyltransferase [Caldilineaceae bacterium]